MRVSYEIVGGGPSIEEMLEVYLLIGIAECNELGRLREVFGDS
jgi:hypothetical protein